jgi:hypothetical protein
MEEKSMQLARVGQCGCCGHTVWQHLTGQLSQFMLVFTGTPAAQAHSSVLQVIIGDERGLSAAQLWLQRISEIPFSGSYNQQT